MLVKESRLGVDGRVGTRTPHKGDPAGVTGGFAAPARHHHQTTGDAEGNDAQDDEEQRGDPLRGQLRRGAVPVSAVDGLALPEQAHSQGAWIERGRRWPRWSLVGWNSTMLISCARFWALVEPACAQLSIHRTCEQSSSLQRKQQCKWPASHSPSLVSLILDVRQADGRWEAGTEPWQVPNSTDLVLKMQNQNQETHEAHPPAGWSVPFTHSTSYSPSPHTHTHTHLLNPYIQWTMESPFSVFTSFPSGQNLTWAVLLTPHQLAFHQKGWMVVVRMTPMLLWHDKRDKPDVLWLRTRTAGQNLSNGRLCSHLVQESSWGRLGFTPNIRRSAHLPGGDGPSPGRPH